MFGRKSSAERARHDTRSAAMRGLERGKHRAEALRESLPEADEVLATLREQAETLREQAEPVLKAAREQVEKSAGTPKKKRSKKPFLFIGLAVVGAVLAYLFFAKRDKEPAYLMDEPESPDVAPAQPSPGASSGNGYSPSNSPSGTPANDEDVPERASAFMAQQPAQPTQAGSAQQTGTPRQAGTPQQTSTMAGASSTPASATQPANGQAAGESSYRSEPNAQVAAWDLPSSSVPPMRGGGAQL